MSNNPQFKVDITASDNTKPGFDSALATARRASLAIAGTANVSQAAFEGANGSVGNLAAQFNDIAVQLSAGQSPFLIAIQQGTQVGQVLGPMGAAGAAKSLTAAFLTMISPVNLITIAAIAAVAATGEWLLGMIPKTEDANQALAAHKKQLDDILVGYDAVRQAADKTIEEAQKLPAIAARSDLEASQRSVADNLEQTLSRIAELQGRINDELSHNQMVSGSADVRAEFERLQQTIAAAGLSTHTTASETENLIAKLTLLKNSTDDADIVDFTGEALDLSKAVRQLQGNSDAAANSMSKLLSTMDPAAMSKALDTLSSLGREQLTPRQQATASFGSIANDASASWGDKAVAADAYAAALNRIAEAETDEAAKAAAKKAAEEAKQQADAYRTVIQSIQDETTAIGMNAEQQEALRRIREAGVALSGPEADYIREQVHLQYQQQAAVDAVAEAQKRAQLALATAGNEARTVLDGMISDFKQGKDALTILGDTLSKVGEDFLNSGLDMLFNPSSPAAQGGGLFGAIGSALGSIFHFASGTNNAPGGLSLVGENGPELLNLPAGSQIIPNNRLGGLGGSMTVQIIDQRSSGSIKQQSFATPDGQKGLRLIIRDEVREAYRRALPGFG